MIGRNRQSRHETEQDFELNIASIIDCFTVLIAFLLVSTSFVSIGILDAEVAASGEVHTPDASPVSVVVDLKSDQSMYVHVSGQVSEEVKISPKSEGSRTWNYESMESRLQELKTQWPQLTSIVVMADNAVAYQDVIKSMEHARKIIPAVNLGGF